MKFAFRNAQKPKQGVLEMKKFEMPEEITRDDDYDSDSDDSDDEDGDDGDSEGGDDFEESS